MGVQKAEGRVVQSPEAGATLVSCSFEHMCLRKGGMSVQGVGKAGERSKRCDWSEARS